MKRPLPRAVLRTLAVFAVGVWTVIAQAQPPAARPRVPSMESGLTPFQTKCMTCHSERSTTAPTVRKIREMSPEQIYAFLSKSSRPEHHAGLTDAETRRMSEFMGGYRQLGSAEAGNPKNFPNACPSNPPMSNPLIGPGWNGWGADIANTRYQRSEWAGLTKADLPRLKLKWAWGFPLGLSAYNTPAVVGGRVFTGSDIGWVYSLDAKTGCYYWGYETGATVRGAITVGPIAGHGDTRYAVYFGDFKANVYALDAQTGHLLWKRKVEDHWLGRVTGSPTLYNGRLYVPVSTAEEWQGGNMNYECCTARGSVAALDANTGEKLWQAYVMDEPKPTRKNPNGMQLFAPGGGAVWNSPTVDPLRRALYFGTGDTETEPAQPMADGIMAVDLDTGMVLWSYQATPNDSFLIGCNGPQRSLACPQHQGPDSDIGNSPILRTLPDGRRVVIAGTKEGDVFALDPDNKGRLIWRVNANPNGGRGGIVWGGAADFENVYYGLASGGVVALRMADGQRLWYQRLGAPGTRLNNSAAATMIPGVIFVGGTDGILRALSATDGSPLWEFATARDFDTVNHVAGANGGAITSVGPVFSGGMMFIGSGVGGVSAIDPGNVLLAFGPE